MEEFMIEFSNKVAAAFKEASKTVKIEIAVVVAVVLVVVALVF
jgi:hypothetical protein